MMTRATAAIVATIFNARLMFFSVSMTLLRYRQPDIPRQFLIIPF